MVYSDAQRARSKYVKYLAATGNSITVDATEAREHVLLLKARGMSNHDIFLQSQYSCQEDIHSIASGRNKRIYRDNAKAILAIPVPDVPAGRGLDVLGRPIGQGLRIPALGSTRRLQGLQAAGFPIKWLADRMGRPPSGVTVTSKGHSKSVYATTAEEIRLLAEELDCKDPVADYGIPVSDSRRAASYAKRSGYAILLLWDLDDIDNPEAFPNITGSCGTTTGRTRHMRSGSPICSPCKKAHADYMVRRNLFRQERKNNPDAEWGVLQGGERESKWDDPVLLARLRADFEAWMPSDVMREKYGNSISDLRRAALRDNNWTHDYATNETIC